MKAALAANNCSSVFWMGNLKNKDLHGDEILSQVSSIASQQSQDLDDENDNDELPEDETNLEDDLGIEAIDEDNTDDSVNSSRSKCF